MNSITTGNKYLEGQVVYARLNTTLKLRVRRFIDKIYYCTVVDNPEAEEQVYFERELQPKQVVNLRS